MARAKRRKTVLGWREWVTLPGLCDVPMKAKVDTGAQTSALHAFRLEVREGPSGAIASFELHPHQRSTRDSTRVEVPVHDSRRVRSSNGKVEHRPVIMANIRIGANEFPIEVTLTRRDEMGFRMLLGRSAVRKRYVIDPGRSYLGGRDQEAPSP